ncbi:universal stress protein [Halobacterium wangiae]|uniref:universal stress protein n=1 Tax=Halobacterium wangiae TaxID=2902623 RepID=UPI001E5BA75D|nr:universal stress protein [Halobacterium wangiae]
MFDQILFPADGSDCAEAAFDYVLEIAAGHDATVHVLNVADTTRSNVERQTGLVETLEERGEQLVRDVAERADERGVDTTTEVRRGEPYRTILDYAEETGVDVIAMPTRGRRGLERFLLGSTTERVLRRSDVPVLTIKPNEDAHRYPFENVLVPTDGSDTARAALEVGAGVATEDDAAVHLLSVIDITGLGVDARIEMVEDALEQNARDVVADAATVARDAGVETVFESVEVGTSIQREIRSYVKDNDVDLVVAGTHGRTGFDRYVLGSVTEQLVRTSPVPVLTVRRPTDER